MAFVLPKTLTAGTNENVSDVQANDAAIRDELNAVTQTATLDTSQIASGTLPTARLADGSVTTAKIADGTITAADCNATFAKANVEPAFATYKTIVTAGGSVAGLSAGGWVFGGAGLYSLSSVAAGTDCARIHYIDPADFTADTRSRYYRLRVTFLTNSTAPGTNFTFGLYPVSGVGTSTSISVGAVVAGSTVAFNAQAANTRAQANSGDFAAPAADYYCMALSAAGSQNGGSLALAAVWLQMRQV